MDFSALKKTKTYYETKFRSPLRIERQIGLWVDRIGENLVKNSRDTSKLRKLGQYAVVFIDSGYGTFASPTTGEVEIKAGDVIILFPDEPNVYYPVKTWHEKFIVWNGPDAARFEKLGYLSKQKMVIHDSIGIISTAYDRLKINICDESKASILERKNIIDEIVCELFKLSAPKTRREELPIAISAAMSWLTKNYKQDISIADLALKYSLSESHFRRHFKLNTGRSPREFITSLRISRAKALLKQGASVKEAALASGYKDVFYFMRVFKKITGTSCSKFKAD